MEKSQAEGTSLTTMVSGAGPLASKLQTEPRIPRPLNQWVSNHFSTFFEISRAMSVLLAAAFSICASRFVSPPLL